MKKVVQRRCGKRVVERRSISDFARPTALRATFLHFAKLHFYITQAEVGRLAICLPKRAIDSSSVASARRGIIAEQERRTSASSSTQRQHQDSQVNPNAFSAALASTANEGAKALPSTCGKAFSASGTALTMAFAASS